MTKVNVKISVLLVACTCLFTCRPKSENSLLIATAANMQFAMKEIIGSFTETTGISCKMVTASSGTLTAQIREGAPFDVFVSANMLYPNELFNQGYTTGAPRVYAYGSLVLWSMTKGIRPDINLLTAAEISHIAIANPRTAPYGAAAVEALKRYQIYDGVNTKLVYGESIAQTNQFIVSTAAEVGFTAKSVVLSPAMKGLGQWKEIDRDAYTPIAQGAVILKSGKAGTAPAQKFYAFLSSEEGKRILTKFGYVVSNK